MTMHKNLRPRDRIGMLYESQEKEERGHLYEWNSSVIRRLYNKSKESLIIKTRNKNNRNKLRTNNKTVVQKIKTGRKTILWVFQAKAKKIAP